MNIVSYGSSETCQIASSESLLVGANLRIRIEAEMGQPNKNLLLLTPTFLSVVFHNFYASATKYLGIGMSVGRFQHNLQVCVLFVWTLH